ncbi:hypothetical protein Tco_0365331 [Tanacetum coccineum]
MENTLACQSYSRQLIIHNDHPKGPNARRILHQAVQTRGEIQKASFKHKQALKTPTITQALQDESWVEAMQEELLHFKLQKVYEWLSNVFYCIKARTSCLADCAVLDFNHSKSIHLNAEKRPFSQKDLMPPPSFNFLVLANWNVKSEAYIEGRGDKQLICGWLEDVLQNLLIYGLYALTHNPTIYDSLVKQFWQIVTVRTLANRTQQLVASIDSKEYTITKATVRSKLQLADATGINNLSDAKIYAGLATLGGYSTIAAPAMLAGAAMDQGEGSAQPAEPHPTPVDPLPSTSLPPNQSQPHSPHQSQPHSPHQSQPHLPHQSPPHSPHQSPPHLPFQSPPYSPPHSSPPRSYEAPLPKGNTSGSAEASIQLKELMVLVPTWMTIRESMKEKSTYFFTPTKASWEAQEEEETSPTILEAAKTLSKVASQSISKEKLTDKGKRYRRRARSMAKKINTKLDAEDEINTGRVEINTGIEDVNTGSTKVDSGRREGKAQMVEEDIQATHKNQKTK